MRLNFDSEKPIYLQLAESIEDDILKGIFEEESQVVSTTELAVSLRINPATAGKGLNLLLDEGVLYKKRGVGMFVTAGARERILQKRRESFYQNYVRALLTEAMKIGVSVEEIIAMIKRGESNEQY
ncbi:MAG: GntR family transcriptional regulator [Bacillota bacterium]